MIRGLLIVSAAVIGTFAQNTTNPCDGCGFGGYASDPTDCSFFYQCVSGSSFRQPCPPGLEFNAKLSVCDWPCRANCSFGGNGGVVTAPPTGSPPTGSPPTGSPPTVSPPTGSPPTGLPPTVSPPTGSPPTIGPPTVPTYPCTSMNAATLPIAGDCTKYIYCYQGYPYTVVCQAGEMYDCKQHSCIAETTCPAGCGGGAGSVTCPSSTTTTLEFPGDTTKYYYCYQGYPYIVQCLATQHYDASQHACEPN